MRHSASMSYTLRCMPKEACSKSKNFVWEYASEIAVCDVQPFDSSDNVLKKMSTEIFSPNSSLLS